MNSINVYVSAHQNTHATLQFKYFDVDNNYYSQTSTSSTDDRTSWKTTGIVYTGNGNNTNITVAAGGQFNGNLYVESVQSNTQYKNDATGTLIAINADIGSWSDVSIDCGQTTKLINGVGVTPQEAKLLSTNEYFFLTQKPFTLTPQTICTVSGKAQPGVTPSAWPVITFASRGSYLSTTGGKIVLHSAAKDDSSYTNVYTRQTVTLATNAGSASV
jgi:hypothetical protein